jgi:hypothetical protein
MLLASLALAPSVMVAASAAERRGGPAVAGWLVAAPFSLAVALVALGPASGAVAASAAAHVPAQVAFALAFAVAAPRGGAAGFAAGGAAYVATAVALPEWAGLAAALPAVAAAVRLRPIAAEAQDVCRAPREDRAVAWRDVVVRAGVAVVFVAVVCSATAVVGPQVGGAVAAFPAMSGSLALLVHRAEGAQAAVGVLRGLVHGLGGYFAFAATVALLAPSPAAVPAGVVACGVAGRTAWKMMQCSGKARRFGSSMGHLERVRGNLARSRY